MSIFFHVVEDRAIKNRTRDVGVMHKLNLIHPWTSATCIVPFLSVFSHCDNYIIVEAGSILFNEEQSLNSFSVSRARICDGVRAGYKQHHWEWVAQLFTPSTAKFKLMESLEQTPGEVNIWLGGIAYKCQGRWHPAAQCGAPGQILCPDSGKGRRWENNS